MRKVSRKARTQYDITVKLYEITNCNSSVNAINMQTLYC